MTAMPALPDAAWDEVDRKRAFWDAHYNDFLQRYPDQYVAVRSGEIVAITPSLEAIVKAVRALDLGPKDVWLQFITEPHPRLL